MLPDVKTMAMEEKLLTMRNLWDDMRQGFESSAESKEICALLNERVARVESGKAELLDWDKVKGSIGTPNGVRQQKSNPVKNIRNNNVFKVYEFLA